MASSNHLPLSAAVTLACVYEATAEKPGNVHPNACFGSNTTYAQFVASAVAIGPIIGDTMYAGVGNAVLNAIRATRSVAHTNTNLGTVLLLAPLAAVPAPQHLAEGIGKILAELTDGDTAAVYQAISEAGAGGIGHVAEADVRDGPPVIRLVEAMHLARDRDLIAKQFTNQFADVFRIAGWIEQGLQDQKSLSGSIIHSHIRQMSLQPDSLIQRKCGPTIAVESSQRAANVLRAETQGDRAFQAALSEFDLWLRADGNRRNPGTTADLIAAALFVLLREDRLHWTKW